MSRGERGDAGGAEGVEACASARRRGSGPLRSRDAEVNARMLGQHDGANESRNLKKSSDFGASAGGSPPCQANVFAAASAARVAHHAVSYIPKPRPKHPAHRICTRVALSQAGSSMKTRPSRARWARARRCRASQAHVPLNGRPAVDAAEDARTRNAETWGSCLDPAPHRRPTHAMLCPDLVACGKALQRHNVRGCCIPLETCDSYWIPHPTALKICGRLPFAFWTTSFA